eukprot:4000282-Prorocentrum_lima.AAC.1
MEALRSGNGVRSGGGSALLSELPGPRVSSDAHRTATDVPPPWITRMKARRTNPDHQPVVA